MHLSSLLPSLSLSAVFAERSRKIVELLKVSKVFFFFFLSIALTLGNLNYYLIIFDKAFWEGFDDDYFDLILCGSLDMTTERCTHFDLFKVASRTVKLMVIACKFTLFLSSVIALSGVVPVVICLVRYMYINTVVC